MRAHPGLRRLMLVSLPGVLLLASSGVTPARAGSGASSDEAKLAETKGMPTGQVVANDADTATAVRLQALLEAKFPATFAGVWIDSLPTVSIQVRVMPADVEAVRLLSGANAGTSRDVLRVDVAPRSLRDLESAQEQARSEVRAAGIVAASDIDIRTGRVLILARTGADAAIARRSLSDPDVVVNVAPDSPTVGGGAGATTCTIGFAAVRNSVYGFTTAGHCSNSQTYFGTSIPYVSDTVSVSYDMQFHSQGSLGVFHSLELDGRLIWSTTGRDSQVVGQSVCKYGSATGYNCGSITSRSYAPSWIPAASATFITAHNASNVDLSNPGDSGGPVFWNSSAFGEIIGEKCCSYIDMIYQAVNYFLADNIVVLTS